METGNTSNVQESNEFADRVALNRQLAQMLKGGVIMDVTTRSRRGLPRTQERPPLWR